MDSNFNNPHGTDTPVPAPAAPVATPDAPAAAPPAPSAPAAEAKPASPAEERFQSCRWRKPAENGTPDHCTHRDVLPMAGTAGFAPDSWCGDCGYFKAKRSPRKRPDQQSNDNWRW